MLITIKQSASADDIHRICQWLAARKLDHCSLILKGRALIVLEKNPTHQIQAEISEAAGVEHIVPISTPYKLASLSLHSQKTTIDVGGVKIGGNQVILMAGPCAIENEEQLEQIAKELKAAGVPILRGSAYKPRSSPYSFQGLGEEGLKLHLKAQKNHGMKTITEVMNPQDVMLVATHVDILQIGARNMQNYDLLKAVGSCGKPVILKRGLSATIEEWLLSAEYILAHGNPNVILCERGIRTYETATRSTLDLSSIPVLKQLTHLPVIVDPSHAAGRKDLIAPLSKAAIAAGADGLLIEVHHDPGEALCDGKQSLIPRELTSLIPELRKIAVAVGRSL